MNETVYVYGVVYKITNLINNKIYIGQTIHSIEERLNGHIRQAEKFEVSQQMLIARAINKHGKENFVIEVICSAGNKNELNFQERFYIRFYNSLAKNGFGYNLAEGGSCGNLYVGKTKEEIEKISKKQRENHTGRIIINDGLKYICVLKKDLIYYLNNGWELGKGNVIDEQTLKRSRFKNGNKHRNTVWMNNGIKNIKIKKDDEKFWLKNGFVLGALSNRTWIHKGEFESQINKEDLDEFIKAGFKVGRKTSSLKNRAVINNGLNNKAIKVEFLDKYLLEGWVLGGVKRGKNKLKTVHRENEQKQIPFEDLEKYLNEGWFVGMKKQKEREKGKKAVHKDSETKFVNREEVEYYLSLGYKIGSSKRKKPGEEKLFTISEEAKEKIRQKIKNKAWVNDGLLNKYIEKQEIDFYLQQGYKRGKLQKSKTNN